MTPKITNNSEKESTSTERQKLYKPKDEESAPFMQKRFSEHALRHGFWKDRTFNL